ncbi:MAG: MOSC domain-containing protein [Gemmatimonadota bacterium]
MKATITEMYLYPVKGCRGFGVRAAQLPPTGLEVDGIGDREWVVVDADGRFLSQRKHPRMALVETRFAGDALRLKAPGMLGLEVPFASEGDVVEVRVWDDEVSAVTQGEIADVWFSSFLGVPARLVRFDPEGRRIASRRYTGSLDVPYKFADAFPLLITGRASLADLNARLARIGETAVTMTRFRPNIVLDGLAEFEEDYVRSIRRDGLVLQPVKPCARCTVPGVDPMTGEASTVVPDLLATFRGKADGVMFGVNAIALEGAGATLAVGDEFEVELNV